VSAFGGLQGLINCAGIGIAEKVLNKDGPQKLANFAASSTSTWSAAST
jgi:hypothetical protein